MATQRYISTSFWDDRWIRSINPADRYLYLYLMTNPLTNIAGVYEITLDRIAFDTGYDERALKTMLEKFAKDGKAFFFQGEWMILPTWPKHQQWEKRSKIKDGIVAILKTLSPEILGYMVNIGYKYPIDTLSIPYTYPSNYSDLDSDSDIDSDIDSYGVLPGAEDPAPDPKSPPQIPVIEIITNAKYEYPITQADIDLFEESYPGVNVIAELKRFKAWSYANPKKRKTKAGMMRAINSWLSREQDKAGSPSNSRYQDNKPRIADSALHPSTSRGPLPTDGKPIVTDFTL
jgi:hypothetical protein